ncbi:MAG: PP2C family protein-serine/threonine phosphatase [bacterium]|nr:PP2C family protein-serine/threonine phosphatase [bacterium]
MRQPRETLLWSAVGLIGAGLLAWGFPRALPLVPGEWEVSRSEAEAIALERLRDLGEPFENPYIVVGFRSDLQLERRLQIMAAGIDRERLRASELAAAQLVWDVEVYAPGAAPGQWGYRAQVSRTGEVLMLRKRSPGDPEGELIDEETLRNEATRYLASQGFEPARFAAEPELRRDVWGLDAVLRYRSNEQVLGADYPYGVEVTFDAGEVTGFQPWYEDPHREELRSVFRHSDLGEMSRLVLLYALLPVVAIAFLKRYHDGQLGVRRGVQFFLLTLAAGIVFVALDGRVISRDAALGFVTRHQTTWLVGAFVVIFQFLALAVLALMSWSVGESVCRKRWAEKLASLDALFKLRWTNATFARAALRGLAGGMVMAGALFALSVPAQKAGAWAMSEFPYGAIAGGPAPWLAGLAATVSAVVPLLLFACLLVPCWVTERFGSPAGLAAAMVAMVLLAPQLIVLPLGWGWAIGAVGAVVPVLLFRFGDLLSALLAGVTATMVVGSATALFAGDPGVQLAGYAGVLLAALPLIVSARYLGSEEELTYTWDDVPPHVRRIAERERQRLELETAARIQSSILPQLPPQLHGIEIAHSYLPATEVGGDFYDVLALDDGRLAVAVGDVAGHGVSSGLIMSMAKSALAVQVSFAPEVAAVFTTLNRMVYQSARQRLLTTLCYALIDPRRRELSYASAGHLFPYRVSPGGEVSALEAASYPLGVRRNLEVRVRTAQLAPRDAIFLYSDGLVEACPPDGDEQFGFERLEASLRRHGAGTPPEMRDGVLADVAAYAGGRPREDDQTVLVLRLPAA